MKIRGSRTLLLALLLLIATLAVACGGDDDEAGEATTTGTGETQTTGAAKSGGDLVIARVSDSISMDKTSVFDNESIWIFEQIYEMLYTVTPDGKDVKPWLATSYELSDDKLTYTFHLRPGVKFSNGDPMTSADVKFSIDEASTTKGGWEFINIAIKDVQAPDPETVVIHTKYPWAPLVADLALFNNGVIPKDYGGMTKEEFYKQPVGTGPFVWDHWTKGQELKLVKNPDYWQEGKPYLDSVTWTTVGDDNTRILQLKGGQAHINEFPPFSAISQLQETPGVVMQLFPSTRTDYILLNHKRKPFDDVHVRRAISYAIDREALVKSLLFENGEVAKSFMPPQVPFYDPNSPGLQLDLDKAKEEMAQSSVPDGFSTEFLAGSGDVVETSIAEIVQQSLEPLGIKVTIKKLDTSTVATEQQGLKYDMSHSYWTMDIADPDELVTFAVDPDSGAHSFYTSYRNPEIIKLTKQAQASFDEAERAEYYSQIQTIAAEDAFMVFLYHSPFRYAHSDKVKGFQVYPTGNYHMEDVSLTE